MPEPWTLERIKESTIEALIWTVVPVFIGTSLYALGVVTLTLDSRFQKAAQEAEAKYAKDRTELLEQLKQNAAKDRASAIAREAELLEKVALAEKRVTAMVLAIQQSIYKQQDPSYKPKIQFSLEEWRGMENVFEKLDPEKVKWEYKAMFFDKGLLRSPADKSDEKREEHK